MKTKVTLLQIAVVIVLLLQTAFLFSQVKLNDDEDFYFTTFTDPTFSDAGFQVGLGIRKELLGGWVGLEASTYPDLNGIGYWDLVAQGGIAIEIGKTTILGGARIGRIEREGNPFGLAGTLLQIEVEIFNGVLAGGRLWLDYREDNKNEFYGDSDGHTYLIFSNPLLQENGAFTLTFLLN